MPPPTEPGIGENADARTSPAPDAATQPKKSKSKTKSKPKPKPKPKPKHAKTAGADKRAADEPGDAGDAGHATAADEGAPVMTCLRAAHIEPAASLPPPPPCRPSSKPCSAICCRSPFCWRRPPRPSVMALGAILGDRKLRVAGMGPGATFTFAVNNIAVNLVAKYYREFSAQNTMQGDAGTLSVRVKF